MSNLKINSIENLAGTRSTSTDNIIAGCAKAWVNFNGTGTVAIRSSYNVSSILDINVGSYAVNFTNALSANHAGVGSCNDPGGGGIFDINAITATRDDFSSIRVSPLNVQDLSIINYAAF